MPDGTSRNRITALGLPAGPALALVLLLAVDLDPGNPAVTRTAAVAAWMAVWWMTQAVPLAATALLPLVLFPLLGIMDGRQVAPLYMNHILFLFIGGFLVALAMQRWDLHRRIALRILLLVGARPSRLLLGFMAASAFLSMWISNTATTMMMVPIAMAVVYQLEAHDSEEGGTGLATGLLLGVAYAASIGGVATLVGTPPNPILARVLAIQFPGAPELDFATWFALGLPLAVLMLAVAWSLLAARYTRGASAGTGHAALEREARTLGPITFEEGVVLADFVLLALLWLTRADIPLGGVTLPGWSRLLENPGWMNDGTVAIGMALILFLVPSRRPDGGRLLDWNTTAMLPWDIVVLIGGGFALAAGFKDSGLSAWFGHQLASLGFLHPLLLIFAVCILLTFLTELTSNTATASLFLPILASLAVAVRIHPLLLMIPGALSCSFAFMLPVATPPNAIAFGSGRIDIGDMARTGLRLNLVGALVITVVVWTLGTWVLGIDPAIMPAWAVE